ncbi:MAG: ATP-binding protein [Cyclobacteriaceae bacterium]|nr:ATP-binding protein [Cyclobacteriaceae bacterium]
MAFKSFANKTAFRVFLIIINVITSVEIWLVQEIPVISVILTLLLIIQVYELNYFVSQTNRKLIGFLESIRYSDFITGFSSGNELGSSFKELNFAFNDVLEAFRKARSEKEEHLQYLNIVVEHINVGVLSFDEEGNVGLMNAASKKLIGLKNLRNIEELIENNSRLYKVFFDLPTGKSALFKTNEDTQLSINATEVRLAGRLYKLLAIQNIQPELQKKELEAWQNLTKILRHEIMNSITPISSLTSTMKDILALELEKREDHYVMPEETASDLQEGLITIADRSKGLIGFINAFRDYTSIPLPNIREISVQKLFENVFFLMKTDLKNKSIHITQHINPPELCINADEEQIQQVLINIIKNSSEAFENIKNPQIEVFAEKSEQGNVEIRVRDNGKGIIREALEKIFIPFYTTKKTGSGVGLAWSRQIMQLHHGTISVESEPDKYTQFTIKF